MASERAARGRRAAASALLLVGGALAGCNLVLGLDDYTKGYDTPGDAAADATTTEAGPDTGADALVETDAGTPPVTWAPWPMPNWTSDAGFPVPGALVQKATPSGTGYEDPATLLVWIATDATLRSYEDAVAACRAKGARLPRRIELVTLLDLEASPKGRLPGVLSDTTYWTSSPVRPVDGTPRTWVVDFDRGEVKRKSGGSALAICVLGEEP